MKISIDEIYDSLEQSGKIPHGWKPARGGVRKVKVKNEQILAALRVHYLGEWRKVYRRGRDGTEIHISNTDALEKSGGIKVK
jgi:hypothetical protein